MLLNVILDKHLLCKIGSGSVWKLNNCYNNESNIGFSHNKNQTALSPNNLVYRLYQCRIAVINFFMVPVRVFYITLTKFYA